MAVFGLVTLSVAALEFFFFTDDSPWRTWRLTATARCLLLQIRGTLGRARRFAAVLELAAFDLRLLGAVSEPQ